MNTACFTVLSIAALLALCAFAAWQHRAWRIAHERFVAKSQHAEHATAVPASLFNQ